MGLIKFINPILNTDFYKFSHMVQYPPGIQRVYSTLIPRSNKWYPLASYVIAYGFQGVIQEMHNLWQDGFFDRPRDEVVNEYARYVKSCLGVAKPDVKHVEELHDLGYLPIMIKAVPEGTRVPFGTPLLSIENTDDRFFWLTNYLETYLSTMLWKPCTTATIADIYRKMLDEYAAETSSTPEIVPFQAHDFSCRGMSGAEDGARSGAGHLLRFYGTDTVPAIDYLEKYYGANIDKGIVGVSVPATEHSVMSSYGKADEIGTFRRLVTELYKEGIVSIVSDTWDLWKVIDEYLPQLKDEIMARDGKVVIRPDSGNPADIICGVKSYFSPVEAMSCGDFKKGR